MCLLFFSVFVFFFFVRVLFRCSLPQYYKFRGRCCWFFCLVFWFSGFVLLLPLVSFAHTCFFLYIILFYVYRIARLLAYMICWMKLLLVSLKSRSVAGFISLLLLLLLLFVFSLIFLCTIFIANKRMKKRTEKKIQTLLLLFKLAYFFCVAVCFFLINLFIFFIFDAHTSKVYFTVCIKYFEIRMTWSYLCVYAIRYTPVLLNFFLPSRFSFFSVSAPFFLFNIFFLLFQRCVVMCILFWTKHIEVSRRMLFSFHSKPKSSFFSFPLPLRLFPHSIK